MPPVPAGKVGHIVNPEMDSLSAILSDFNDMFGNIEWKEPDNVRRQIIAIPDMVAKDEKYQNAMKNSDKQNARMESERALQQVIFSVMADNMELFKQFQDNPSFKKWLSDMVFNHTYNPRKEAESIAVIKSEQEKETVVYDLSNTHLGKVAEQSCQYDASVWLSEKQAILKLQEIGYSMNEAEYVLHLLEKTFADVESEYFKIKFDMRFPTFPEGTIGYIAPIREKYYCFDLKKKVLDLIVLLINKFTPMGAFSDVLDYMNKFGFDLDVDEVCVYGCLKEIQKKKQNEEILITELLDYYAEKEDALCQEDNYICKYSVNGICGISKLNVEKVLDKLQKKDVIKRYSSWIEIVLKL